MARAKKKTPENPTKKTPVEILEEIANDPNAPPTSRVQAARALLTAQRFTKESDEVADDFNGAPRDELTKRALRLIRGGGK